MIEGHVDAALRAFITIDAVKHDDSTEPSTTIIDTGFNEEITLPREQIQRLDFPQIGTRDIDLGDDSTATTDVHLGVVLWEGEPRPVMVLRAGETPLVGMELMEHHRLSTEGRRGGKVELEVLP